MNNEISNDLLTRLARIAKHQNTDTENALEAMIHKEEFTMWLEHTVMSRNTAFNFAREEWIEANRNETQDTLSSIFKDNGELVKPTRRGQ